jgi:hypothetical protein
VLVTSNETGKRSLSSSGAAGRPVPGTGVKGGGWRVSGQVRSRYAKGRVTNRRLRTDKGKGALM